MTLFARRSAVPEPTGYSVVDEQMVIRGEINTQGTIRVDGRLEGRLQRAGTMIIGAKGVVVGDIEAREVIVGGIIEGNITSDGRVELQSSASVRGDIMAIAMLLHEGATVHGHIDVDHRNAEAGEMPRLEIARNRSSAALNG
ncbi:MAG: Polymer-forming cytoskeletal family protein [Gemmatimonadetes bacterium]|jgi:cytoskeletal protein CcmA (bactofilin family)|nr:Polymer-forming cytoskeletal family protein [Gemmatimonadota bacterium]